MDIKFYDNDNDLISEFYGEIDESNAYLMKSKLDSVLNGKYKSIILDFKNLDFMDSTGIGVLLGRYKKAQDNNISLYIKNPSNHLDFILKTCGIYTIIQKI